MSDFILAIEDRDETVSSYRDNDFNDVVIHANDLRYFQWNNGFEYRSGVIGLKPIMSGAKDRLVLKLRNFCTLNGTMKYKIMNATQCTTITNNFSESSGTLLSGEEVDIASIQDLFPGCWRESMVNLTHQTKRLCNGREVVISWSCESGYADDADNTPVNIDYHKMFGLRNETQNIDISNTNTSSGVPMIALYNSDLIFSPEGKSIFETFDFTGINIGSRQMRDAMASPSRVLDPKARRRDYIDDPDWHLDFNSFTVNNFALPGINPDLYSIEDFHAEFDSSLSNSDKIPFNNSTSKIEGIVNPSSSGFRSNCAFHDLGYRFDQAQ